MTPEIWDEIELKVKELRLTGVDVVSDRVEWRVTFREPKVIAVFRRVADDDWLLRIDMYEIGFFYVPGTTDHEMLEKLLSPKNDPEFQKEMEDRILEAHEKWVEDEPNTMMKFTKEMWAYVAVEAVLGKVPDRDDI